MSTTSFCLGCESHLQPPSSENRISPAPQLLQTNQVPSSTEVHAIRQCLFDVDEEIQQVESQILEVQSILARLKKKQERLQLFADEHRALLSPLRRLFPELLSEIFSWCPKGAPAPHSAIKIPDSFDPLHGPLLVSQVCRSWRVAAIATPQLWTAIRLVLSPRSNFKILDLFLSRSGDCDLTIGVMDDLNISDPIAAHLAQSTIYVPELLLLAREAHRWRSAIFFLPPFTVYWDALSEAKGKTNRLQHLGVYHSRRRLQEPLVDIFADSPNLTSVSLNCHVPVTELLIDGSRVTHFRYEKATVNLPFVDLELCVEAMRILPNLEYCVLDCLVYGPSLWQVGDIVLEKLKHLDVKIEFTVGTHGGRGGAFWNALQLPNLSILQVESQSSATFFDPGPFSRLVGRCQHLTELGMVWRGAEAGQLLEVMKYCGTTVMSLSLGLCRESFPQVLSTLAQTEPAPTPSKLLSKPLLPGLGVLRLYPIPLGAHVPSDNFLGAFLRMARQRMTKVSSNSKERRNRILDTAFLHYPRDVGAAVKAVKACLRAMELTNADGSMFPAQMYCLKSTTLLHGSVIKIQRS